MEQAMAKNRYNARLVKIHRSYIVGEIATLYNIHRNTVRAWIKEGLLTTDDQKPFLIRGHDLYEFLIVKRNKNKSTCQLDEIYCVRCHAPKKPLGMMADYKPPILGDLGNIVGICPDCECLIYRRTSTKSLELIRRHLDITIPMANQRICEID